jgi:hypothetical protein
MPAITTTAQRTLTKAIRELSDEHQLEVDEATIKDGEIFQGTSLLKGDQAWFFRIAVTGLHPRKFGPYGQAGDAVLARDILLTKIRYACRETVTLIEDESVLEFIEG